MIEKHYWKIKQAALDIDLCVVSKHHSIKEIQSYYDAGERIFAENRTAELVSKAAVLPKDIAWHYIGHLQRNKVKEILPIVSCIQSLDNIALAKVIEKEATKLNRTVDVLIELHLANEDSNKSGLDSADVETFTNFLLQECPHISIQGLMTMGPHTEDTARIHEVFAKAQDIFKHLQEIFGKQYFHTLSMGMSHDYPIAIEHGSTMLRIGTYVFDEGEL